MLKLVGTHRDGSVADELVLLRDDDKELVIDEDWQEPLLDISTRDKRAALAQVVGKWIDGCATSG